LSLPPERVIAAHRPPRLVDTSGEIAQPLRRFAMDLESDSRLALFAACFLLRLRSRIEEFNAICGQKIHPI
jgi:hypothetical protein